MNCLSCGADVPQGSGFCPVCGAAAPNACPSCGHPNSSAAKFCAHCGGKLAADPVPAGAAASALSAERRQLTVMFCDLVGSTALSARLDPEELRDVMAAFHQCCAEAITRASGFVAKYIGDGVLAYFGYPRAHEDDAERAVRAALGLIEAVGKLPAAGARLQVRIGVATGLVVVGDLIGQDAALEQAMVGETPNLAALLQALAEPGTVVIGASTRRLLGRLFEYRDLGVVALEGWPEPVPAFQVLGASAEESRFEARQEGGIAPLVGREEELALLLRRWRQARTGEGRLVLLTGEPGIGKSRIARALQDRLSEEPHIRLRYFCSPHHRDSPLHPFVAQIEHAARFTREDAPEQRLAKLEVLLAQSGASAEHIGLIAGLLSIATGDRFPVPAMEPQKRKEKTFEALLAQFVGLAARQPVLVIYEDAHWIDPTSLELLSLAVERTQRLPVLRLITARPEFKPPWPDEAHATTLALHRLSRQEAAALVDRVTGGKTLPAQVMEQILARTDGVPLFVEELTKTVVESGLLHETDGRYALTGPLPPLAIPATLHDSLMERLDRLAPVREVVQIGAALGRQFSYELLRAVAHVPEDRLQPAMRDLVRSELVFCRGTPPASVYTFKHALVQDAAYSTMLRSRRRQLHARIVATVERQFPEIVAREPERLARHCAEAGLMGKAIEYWLEAGRQALARSMMAEAVVLLRNGVALLPRAPEDVRRQELELDLQIALGQALIATHGWGAPLMGEAYARARELCDVLGSPRKLVPVLYGQVLNDALRADLGRAEQLAAEMRQLGEMQDDVVTRVVAYRVSGYACLHLGDFVAARAYLERGLALYDPAHRLVFAELAPNDALVTLLALSSAAVVSLGYLDLASSRRDEARAEALRLSHAYSLAYAVWWSWYLGWFARSEPGVLLQSADELLALSGDGRFAFWRAMALAARGWCLAALGHPEQGIPLLASGLIDYHATGNTLMTPLVLTMLADAKRIAGQPQAGLEHLAEAERLAETTKERLVLAETLRLRGDLLIQTGDRAAAEISYHRAMTLARQQSAKLWELRAATSLARLWRDAEARTEAHELLAPVCGWFTEGLKAPDLIEANTLLRELS